MRSDEEISTALDNVKSQLRHVGLDPEDPSFWRFAGEAPPDMELYDQVTWAIDRTREEIESNQVEEGQEQVEEAVSIEDALESARGESVL